jgi:hypothetical protein
MIYDSQNFSYSQPVFANGDIIRNCNLSQLLPHTAIGTNVTGLRFEKCNLINCDLPIDAVAVDCNRAQIDWCYWLNPDMPLAVEVANCRHVTGSDVITIDGQLVDTEYYRQDKDV